MSVRNSGFFREAERFISLGASFGWHERNAGNISLLLSPDEIREIGSELDFTRDSRELPRAVPALEGELVFTTVSGSYFTDMSDDCFCICEILEGGKKYRVVWGGSKPTSELNGHLLSLAAFKASGDGRRAVYHCHPAELVALTYLIPCDDKSFTRALWRCETECAFVFPNGLGVVGFNIPGSLTLAEATAEKIVRRDAIVWQYHGLFAAGKSIKDAFGLAHAVSKAAEIKLKIISSGREELSTITDEQLDETAKAFGSELNTFE